MEIEGKRMTQQEIREAVEKLKKIKFDVDGGVSVFYYKGDIEKLLDLAQLVLEIKGVCDHTVSENCLDCDTCKIAECHNRGFNQANSQWRALTAKNLLEIENIIKYNTLIHAPMTKNSVQDLFAAIKGLFVK